MIRSRTLLSCFALVTSLTSPALAVDWSVSPADAASITGGPWVLAEGTIADSTAGFPTDNPGTSLMMPYYHGFTTGSDQRPQT